MFVFLNGRLVPEAEAVVSAFDRGLLYGDGLFETLRVLDGVPLAWSEHWRRLVSGVDTLRLKLPYPAAFLRAQAHELCQRNQLPNALLRITVTRGVGPRGYSPRAAGTPTLLMTLHPAPQLNAEPAQWRLQTATQRVPTGDALTACKSANKLPHVLARAEAEDAGADDALLLNTAGEVAEATCANLFWLAGGALHTPPLTAGALPGVTRAAVLALARELALPVAERSARPEQLHAAEGLFLTLSSLGVVEVVGLDGRKLATSPHTGRLHNALLASWRAEVAQARPTTG